MIIRSLKDVEGTDRDVVSQGWRSRRLLLKKENMGFSMHDTIIEKGAELHMHYKNHLEAVYCIEGKGLIMDKKSGKEFTIEPNTLYALNQHDAHTLIAHTTMRMVCVFNPPISGQETHGPDGAYPLDES